MKAFLNGIIAHLKLNVKPAVGDIASPVDGDIWYNSTTSKFRKRENGVTSDLDTTSGGLTITSGTAAPSGGVDGDIYLQYT